MASTEPSPNNKLTPFNSYWKSSSLAFQLFAAIGIFGWLGYLLDQYLQIKFPAFMLLLGFLAFGGMMVQVYRSIKQENPWSVFSSSSCWQRLSLGEPFGSAMARASCPCPPSSIKRCCFWCLGQPLFTGTWSGMRSPNFSFSSTLLWWLWSSSRMARIAGLWSHKIRPEQPLMLLFLWSFILLLRRWKSDFSFTKSQRRTRVE